MCGKIGRNSGMVIREMKKTVLNLIKEWKDLVIALDNLDKSLECRMTTDADVKESIRLGKKFNKTVNELVGTEEGVFALTQCMEDENPRVRFMAARDLYPLYPKKAMKIMKDYEKVVTYGLKKMSVENVIRGFQNKQKVFVDQFKKMYNCEDLDSLNREK